MNTLLRPLPAPLDIAQIAADAHARDVVDASARFERLYQTHVDMVWRALRSLGVPEAAVPDGAQEVFIQLLRRLSDLQPGVPERVFVFGFVRRVAANIRRGHRRRHEGSPLDEDHASEAPLPDDMVERHLATNRLLRALDTLDPASRELIVLVDLEQVAVTDAATALSLNVNTAYTRLRAARQKLRTVLERSTTAVAQTDEQPRGRSGHHGRE